MYGFVCKSGGWWSINRISLTLEQNYKTQYSGISWTGNRTEELMFEKRTCFHWAILAAWNFITQDIFFFLFLFFSSAMTNQIYNKYMITHQLKYTMYVDNC